MDLTNWTPLRDLDRIFNRMRPITAGLDEDGPGFSLLNADLKWKPAADIAETKEEFIIKADLPEVEKKDIQIDVADGLITIRGERRYEKKSEDEKQHRIESFYGSFERSFTLPPSVDEEAIKAESANGVLTIHLPKREVDESEARKISID